MLVLSLLARGKNLSAEPLKEVELFPQLASFNEKRISEFSQISADRTVRLDKLARYVESCLSLGQPARLTFICTHNSRRSQMSQLWAAAAAAHFGIKGVETFSGGTESTAFNSRAVAALARAGFKVVVHPDGENPKYLISFSDSLVPRACFSKVYDLSPNPSSDFCAVMTCSHADKNCPLVKGTALRIAIPFEDPKVADGTPQEANKYDERCAQIAREMLYVFSKVTMNP